MKPEATGKKRRRKKKKDLKKKKESPGLNTTPFPPSFINGDQNSMNGGTKQQQRLQQETDGHSEGRTDNRLHLFRTGLQITANNGGITGYS